MSIIQRSMCLSRCGKKGCGTLLTITKLTTSAREPFLWSSKYLKILGIYYYKMLVKSYRTLQGNNFARFWNIFHWCYTTVGIAWCYIYIYIHYIIYYYTYTNFPIRTNSFGGERASQTNSFSTVASTVLNVQVFFDSICNYLYGKSNS